MLITKNQICGRFPTVLVFGKLGFESPFHQDSRFSAFFQNQKQQIKWFGAHPSSDQQKTIAVLEPQLLTFSLSPSWIPNILFSLQAGCSLFRS
jgi:hypothetical protein